MDWEKYSKEFFEKASKEGLSSEQISWSLNYGEKLAKKNLPIIFEPEHLSRLVGVKFEYFQRHYKNPIKFYRGFYIRKKDGSKRRIFEPLPNLKFIQVWILEEILYKIETNRFIKSYIPKKSIVDNAKFHRGQQLLVNIDIQDYFGAIKDKMVFNFFKELGYNNLVSLYLSKICTLNGSLPQGAPSSPALSNLISAPIDLEIFDFCSLKKIRYTRYADDLTFSGNFNASLLINKVGFILRKYNFEINYKKLRVRRKHQRQITTGIVVNEKLSIPREKKRELRQSVYYIKKFGLSNHLSKRKIHKDKYLKHLLGKCYFYISIEPKNKEIRGYIEYLKEKMNAST